MQEVEDHIVETYLMRCEKRSDAELDIYVLLATLKDHCHRHPLLHTYSRFIKVLDGYGVDEIKRIADEKSAAKEKKKAGAQAAKYVHLYLSLTHTHTHTHARAHTHMHTHTYPSHPHTHTQVQKDECT